MRDSLSAFDQVRAFAGDSIAVDDVVTVLGLVGRDLVFDMLDAVAGEDAASAFTLVERALERGYDLRLLCRELARATRDLLILAVAPRRAADPDVAGDAERERLAAMSGHWSREDLLRAFDLLTKAEQEIRVSDQPRYNLEMALLRLMHLRKLVPLSELLSGTARVPSVPKVPEVPKAGFSKAVPTAPRPAPVAPPPTTANPDQSGFKDRFLAELKSGKATFYNLVVASAYRIDATPSAIAFVFLPNQRNAKGQCEEQKAWLQSIAERVAGKPVPISIAVAETAASAAPAASAREQSGELRREPGPDQKNSAEELKAEAMANSTVQAVLEIFPVEKTTIEER